MSRKCAGACALIVTMVAALLPIAPPVATAAPDVLTDGELLAEFSVSFDSGWSDLFGSIAESLESQIALLQDTPMLEDRLEREMQAVVDEIDAIRTNTSDAFSDFATGTLDKAAVQQLFVDLLGPGSGALNLLQDSDKSGTVDQGDVTIKTCPGDSNCGSQRYIQFDFDLGRDLPTINIPGFEMSYAPFGALADGFELGMQVDTVKLNLGWTLHVGVGVQASGGEFKGFYIDTGSTEEPKAPPELKVEATATFVGLKSSTTLGLLTTEVTDGIVGDAITKLPSQYNPTNPPPSTPPTPPTTATKLSVVLEVDLLDKVGSTDNRLFKEERKPLNYVPTITGSALLRLHVESKGSELTRTTFAFPGMDDVTVELPTVDYDLYIDVTGKKAFAGTAEEQKFTWGVDKAVFDEVTVGVGPFIRSIAAPVAEAASTLMGPAASVGEVLNARLPVISDIVDQDVTLTSMMSDSDERQLNEFLDAVTGLSDLAETFGDDAALAANGVPDGFNFGCIILQLKKEDGEPIPGATKYPYPAPCYEFSSTDQLTFGFDKAFVSFDLLSPSQVMNLVIGEPADLVSFGLPAFSGTVSKGYKFGWEDLAFTIRGTGNVSGTGMRIIYDTEGIEKVVKAIAAGVDPNPKDLLDGFYVATDEARPELQVDLSLKGSARVDLSTEILGETVEAFYADANVDLGASLGLNIRDPRSGSGSGGELRYNDVAAITQNFSRPDRLICLFSISGAASGGVSATVRVFGEGVSASAHGLVDGAIELGDLMGSKYNICKGFDTPAVVIPDPILASRETVDGATWLTVHAGDFAPGRRYGDIDDSDSTNMLVTVEPVGSDVKVTWDNDGPGDKAGISQTFRGPFAGIIGSVDGTTPTFDASKMTIPVVLTGGPNNDTLKGGAAPDVISGGPGNDTITGNGGNDTLLGDAGADDISGGAGNDTVEGGSGDDVKLDGGDGADIVRGGFGNDTIIGGIGNDTIEGDSGDDNLDGGPGNDIVNGGNGDDTISGGIGDDTISGGRGDDTIDGDAGDDTIDGDAGSDTIEGGSGNDVLRGGADDDLRIAGGEGNDTIDGGTGDDGSETLGELGVLDGGPGNDIIDGGEGNDRLAGGADDDTLRGGNGNDALDGGDGRDGLFAGPGNDDLVAGLGDTWVDGADGSDGLTFDAGTGLVNITLTGTDFREIDAPGRTTPYFSVERDLMVTVGDDDRLVIDGPTLAVDVAVAGNGEVPERGEVVIREATLPVNVEGSDGINAGRLIIDRRLAVNGIADGRVTPTMLTGLGTGDITYVGLNYVEMLLGSGDDRLTVFGTPNTEDGTTTYLRGGPGADNITVVGPPQPGLGYTEVVGDDGDDTLTVEIAGDPALLGASLGRLADPHVETLVIDNSGFSGRDVDWTFDRGAVIFDRQFDPAGVTVSEGTTLFKSLPGVDVVSFQAGTGGGKEHTLVVRDDVAQPQDWLIEDDRVVIEEGSDVLEEINTYVSEASRPALSLDGEFLYTSGPSTQLFDVFDRLADDGSFNSANYDTFGGSLDPDVITPTSTGQAYAFGHSIAVSGDMAVVGNPAANTVHVFARSYRTWIETDVIQAPLFQPLGEFGAAVATDGTNIIVGDPGFRMPSSYPVPRHGGAFVYTYSAGWNFSRILLPPNASRRSSEIPHYQWVDDVRFGASVAIDGGIAVVGAPSQDGFGFLEGEFGVPNDVATLEQELMVDSGAAYVFDGTDWGSMNQITGRRSSWRPFFGGPGGYGAEVWSDTGGQPGDHFGQAVAVSGRHVVVGAPDDDFFGPFSTVRYGTVAWFTNTWTGGVRPDIRQALISGEAVGDWEFRDEFVGQRAGERYGAAVALTTPASSASFSDNVLAVGAPAVSPETDPTGHAYVAECTVPIPNDGLQSSPCYRAGRDGTEVAEGDFIGASVSLSADGETVAAGGSTGSSTVAIATRDNSDLEQPWGLGNDIELDIEALTNPCTSFGGAIGVSGDLLIAGCLGTGSVLGFRNISDWTPYTPTDRLAVADTGAFAINAKRNQLLVMDRNPWTGELSLSDDPVAVQGEPYRGSAPVDGLSGASDLVATANFNGGNVDLYVVGADGDKIAWFRSTDHGKTPSYKRAVLGRLSNPVTIALSRSEDWLYVGNQETDLVSVFARDTNTGELTFEYIVDPGVDGIVDITRAPFQDWVYVAGRDSESIAAMRPERRSDGSSVHRVAVVARNNVDGVRGLDGLSSLGTMVIHQEPGTGPANQGYLFAAGEDADALVVFQQDTWDQLVFRQTLFGNDSIRGLDAPQGIETRAARFWPELPDIYVGTAGTSGVGRAVTHFRPIDPAEQETRVYEVRYSNVSTLTVFTGSKTDTVTVRDAEAEVVLNTKAGGDNVVLSKTAPNQVTTINSGDDSDRVVIRGTGKDSRTSIDTGDGVDVVEVLATDPGAARSCPGDVQGVLCIGTGDGADVVSVSGDHLQGSVGLNAGSPSPTAPGDRLVFKSSVATNTNSPTKPNGSIYSVGSSVLQYRDIEDIELQTPPLADVTIAGSIAEGDNLNVSGLDASGTSPLEGMTFTWDLNGDGSFGDATGAVPVVSWDDLVALGLDDDGDFLVAVRATDGDGESDIASTTLTITNTAPTATITADAADTVDEGDVYTLTLSAIDPGADTISSWSIDWGDGTTETIPGDPTEATHVYDAAGDTDATFTIAVVSVTDEDALVPHLQSATKEITVYDVEPWQLALSGVGSVVEGSVYELTLSAPCATRCRASEKPTSWTVNWGDGNITTETSPTATHTYADGPETHTITAAASGSSGEVFAADNSVTVDVTNVAPTAELSGPSTTTGGRYALGLTTDDPGDDTANRWLINWGDGSTEMVVGDVTEAVHNYDAAPGTPFLIVVESVTDEDGVHLQEVSLSVTKSVTQGGPVVRATGAAEVDEGVYTLTLAADGVIGTVTEWSVDWGDGVVESLPAGPTTFEHLFDGDATPSIVATAFTDDGFYVSAPLDVVVSDVSPIVTPTGSETVDEGAFWTIDLEVVDPGSDFITEFTIDWGDGTSETVTGNPGSVTHVYVDGDHDYTVTGTATDEDGTVVLVPLNVSVLDVAPIPTVSGDATGTEGAPVSIDLSVIDPGVLDVVTGWSIDWGDGTVDDLDGDATSATHTFTDDGDYDVVVTVEQEQGAVSVAAPVFEMSIANVAPTIAVTGDPQQYESDPFVLNLGAVTDPGDDTVTTYFVNWGDGTTFDELDREAFPEAPGPILPPADGTLWQPFDSPGDVSHVFTDGVGRYDVRVGLLDEDGFFATAARLTVVHEGTPLKIDLTPLGDESGDGSYVIDWGDGTESKLEVGHTLAEHVYTSLGRYTITSSIVQDGDETPVSTRMVVVSNVAPTLDPPTANPDPVDEGSTVTVSSSVTDTSTIEDFALVIDWGDESSPFTSDGRIDQGEISENHVYADNGDYTVEVCVTDDDGAETCDTVDITVDNVLPTIDAGPDQIDLVEGLTFALPPAIFHDQGTADTHTATIDWGDGTGLHDGVVTEEPFGPPGSTLGLDGTIGASHVYDIPGTYIVEVCVADDDQPELPVCDQATVAVLPLYFGFAAFATDENGNVSIQADASIDGAVHASGMTGSVGATGDVSIGADNKLGGDVLSSRKSVSVGQRSEITGDAAAGSDLRLNVDTTVTGDASAVRNMLILKGGHVFGDAKADSVILPKDAIVEGDITENAVVGPLATVTDIVLPAIEVGTLDVSILTGGSETLDPGKYHDLVVGSDGHVVLEPGEYSFNSVSLGSGATIEVVGSVVVEVAGDFATNDGASIELGPLDPADVLWRVDGNLKLGGAGSYAGTFFGPASSMELGVGSTLHGALYGQKVVIQRDASIVGRPAYELFATVYL